MELNENGLSPAEQQLAAELSQLAADPTPERHAAIMAAVRRSRAPRRFVFGRWRLALAGVAALAILTGSTVGAFAASSDALPSSPKYPIRLLGEQLWIALAAPADREQLRIRYASQRIAQARAALRQGDRRDASALLRDCRSYLTQAKEDLGSVSSDQQGQIQSELNQTEADEQQAEEQVNQDGPQGGT